MASIRPTQTIFYKTIGEVQIPMDIYLPRDAHKSPILLWFHGGGLLQGRRDLISPHMRAGVEKYNYIAISADYRLAPQVSVGEIFEDVRDCISFIRTELPSILGDSADVSRVSVSGSSAGGFLALLAGLYIEPKPNAIVPIYPITDPLGTFFTTPQPQIEGKYYASKEELASYLDPTAPVTVGTGQLPSDTRWYMYGYMLRTATLAQLWGLPADNSEAAAPYRISRNIQKHGLPPVYIIHGDADTAVGVEQADEVVGAMVGCGLTVEYERVNRADHLFDNEEGYENARLYEFIMRHL